MGEEHTPSDRPTRDEPTQSTVGQAPDDNTVDRYFVGIDSPSAMPQIDQHATAIVSRFETTTFGSAVVCEATADDIVHLESCSDVRFVTQDHPRYPVVVG
jgi:hypothetical protein